MSIRHRSVFSDLQCLFWAGGVSLDQSRRLLFLLWGAFLNTSSQPRSLEPRNQAEQYLLLSQANIHWRFGGLGPISNIAGAWTAEKKVLPEAGSQPGRFLCGFGAGRTRPPFNYLTLGFQ